METSLEKSSTVLPHRLVGYHLQKFLNAHDASGVVFCCVKKNEILCRTIIMHGTSLKCFLLGKFWRNFHRKYLANSAVWKKNLQNKPFIDKKEKTEDEY